MFARRWFPVGAAALMMAVLFAADAAGQANAPGASDPRATVGTGPAYSCAYIGQAGDEQLAGGGETGTFGDDFVRVVVAPADPPGREYTWLERVVITPEGVEAGVVITAVAVKGGEGHNIYRDPYLPPQEPAPQNYRSPLNKGGNVADVSHWLVCYTVDGDNGDNGDPGTGSLRVSKWVLRPVGVPVDALPTTYTVGVRCTLQGEVVRRVTVTFGSVGGVGRTGGGATEITDIPAGARCRVRELNTGALPDGCRVRYVPVVARFPGVSIREDARRRVVVINDCRATPVRRASVRIVKRVVGASAGELPESFRVSVECAYSDPVEVTVSASGEPASVNGIRVGANCLVSEVTGSLPPGVVVTYTVEGSDPVEAPGCGPATRPACVSFPLTEGGVTVTVTNDAGGDPNGPGQPQPPPEPPGEPRPNLDLEKHARLAFVRAGRLVRYTIVVVNRGRGVARRVLVCDRLPGRMTLASTPGARLRNGRVCWRISELRPLAIRRFTVIARAGQRASGPTINVATAAAPGTAQRTARARVRILRQRALPPPVTG